MRKGFLAMALLFGLLGTSVQAAEISCEQAYDGSPFPEGIAKKLWPSGLRPSAGTCATGLLVGTIVKGDYEKAVSLLRKSHPFLGQFKLISSGGSVEEAVSIGRIFRKYMIATDAPVGLNGRFALPASIPSSEKDRHWLCAATSDCICASACALIWFGGPDRFGTVGLHRPRTDDPAFRELGPAAASAVYRRMLDDVRHYLDEMEVPKQMIELMVETGSAELRWVDAIRERLERPPSIAEWEDASCGSFTDEENKELLELEAKQLETTKLPTSEAMLLKLLFEKFDRKAQCENALISSHRDNLSPP